MFDRHIRTRIARG